MCSLRKKTANAQVHYGHRFCPIPNGFDGPDSPCLQREKENPVDEKMEWDDVPQENQVTVFAKSDGQRLGQYPFILDTTTTTPYDVFPICQLSTTERNKLNSPFIAEDENTVMMDCDNQMNIETTDANHTGSRSPTSAFPVFFMSNGLFILSNGHVLEMRFLTLLSLQTHQSRQNPGKSEEHRRYYLYIILLID
ncbi:hypothetical protein HOLleu_40552 [Holothuria leucospilota]|uniref:Uncharacterized protein n=1 Tax=Holothuria leucospilota TaxID=206669 RepID=A0A9Q0YL65_HOLLE|nr:hypothetical protein HOLleu_40552 [Holothuria leucospilota]